MTRDDRLRIAVFIDFDNIEIGVKNTLSASFDAGLVLEALRERGDVVSKTAYSDWQRAGNSYSRMLTQHAIKMVQRNLTPGGDKNGADINLALDALEMAFTHPHINAFVIVGGDSDFISLVEKLKQYDKKVFVIGGRQFTSIVMQRNCHEFIAYEHLVASAPAAVAAEGRRQAGRPQVRVERAPIEQVVPLVSRALQVLSEREVAPQMGLLKTTLLQLDSTFSERDYGAGSFRDFVQKLEKIGVVTLQQGKGGLLVGPGEGKPVSGEAVGDDVDPSGGAVVAAGESEGSAPAGTPVNGAFANGPAGLPSAAPAAIGSNADGVAEFTRLLATGQVRRWPMYLRNVKQFLRQVSPDFDERAYGFAGLVDLLRAAGREGIVRVDRDRQGVIRVFQGSAAPVAPVGVTASTPQQAGDETEVVDVVMGEVVPSPDATSGQPGDDGDEFNRAAPMAASVAVPKVTPEYDEDPNDSIGNRLAPGEVREELIPRRGAKKPPSSRRPATAPPRRRTVEVPTHHASGHGASKRAPRARKTRRSRP